MKKLIAVSIILVLFSGMAFAQLSEGLKLGATGRMMVIPLEVTTYNGEMPDSHDKDNDLSAAGIGSGGWLGGLRPSISGGNEFVGFNFQAWVNRNTIGMGDNMMIWVQPFEWIRLDLGLFKYDRLRGKVGDTDWGAVTLAHGNPDAIFQRFAGVTGALLSIIPNENIYFGAMVPEFINIGSALAQTGFSPTTTEEVSIDAPYDSDGDGTPDTTVKVPVDVTKNEKDWTPAKEMYERVQIAAGYNIDGIGLIRAQYVGAADIQNTAKRIEFAFALTAIENLTVDLGAKIYMPFTQYKDNKAIANQAITKTAINQAHQISLGANYSLDDLAILARVDTKFGAQDGRDKYVGPFTVNFHMVPSYNLGFATVGLEFGIEAASEAKVDTTVVTKKYVDFGMGVWLMRNLGKGYLKGGVAFSYDDALGVTQVPHGYIRIPIIAQFSF